MFMFYVKKYYKTVVTCVFSLIQFINEEKNKMLHVKRNTLQVVHETSSDIHIYSTHQGHSKET